MSDDPLLMRYCPDCDGIHVVVSVDGEYSMQLVIPWKEWADTMKKSLDAREHALAEELKQAAAGTKH